MRVTTWEWEGNPIPVNFYFHYLISLQPHRSTRCSDVIILARPHYITLENYL